MLTDPKDRNRMKRPLTQAERIKRKRRVRLIAVILLALILLLALVLFKKLYLEKPSTFDKDGKILEGPYLVSKVADGDTFYIKKEGKTTKVRLIGVNAPESVAPPEYGKENTKEGKEAAEFLSKLIVSKNVYLEFDLDTYDQYGRLLAYVYLSDEVTMVQEILLSEGYAQVMTIQPNSKYADQFLKLQQKAQAEGKGFWKQ